MVLAQGLAHEVAVKLLTGAAASSDNPTGGGGGNPVLRSHMWLMQVLLPHWLLPETSVPLHADFSKGCVNGLKT